jgi:RNA polymerase sigma-54 factor
MPQQGLYQSAEMRQDLVIAPHQIQSLEMLTAHFLELQARISQEIEQNPTLESVELRSEELVGDPMEDATAPQDNPDLAGAIAEKDEFLAKLVGAGDSWRDYLPPSHGAPTHTTDDEERRRFFFDSLTTSRSLTEELVEQLRTGDASPRLQEIATVIIGNISDTGYLRADTAEVCQVAGCDEAEFQEALDLVQTFEPVGIGARDLRECLLLQLQRMDQTDGLAYRVADQHLAAIGRNRIPEVARKLGVNTSALYQAIESIKRLQPRPGNAIPSDTDEYVIPEVHIEKQNGEYSVTLNKACMPKLRISERYMAILEDPKTPKDVRSYIKEHISSGNLLMNSVSQRQDTILKIAQIIARRQIDYFEEGEQSLRPMTMGQVAEEIGVHETTVGRAIANKYLQSPRGLVPMRQFFSTGYHSDSGEDLSARSIQAKIETLVGNEDSGKPLSDQKIVTLLAKDGLKVARRTVAKYREGLGIPSSHLRKTFKS